MREKHKPIALKNAPMEYAPLAEVQRAHELIEEAGVQGKIVLTVGKTTA
jgi:hypothetical protein